MNMNLKTFSKTETINLPQINKAIRANQKKLCLPQYKRYANALKQAKLLSKKLQQKKITPNYKITKDLTVKIGEENDLNPQERKIFLTALQNLIPWRKGPFEIFGERINAEWDSALKWQCIQKIVGSLQGRRILDIGCNNGYYLHLMAKQKPKFLLGIDPTLSYYLQHQFITEFCELKNTTFGLFGVEDLTCFDKSFDIVFCLGILYHHQNPFEILKKIFHLLRPGGILIAESQGIQKDGPYFLLPQTRYMGLPGFWFLPTKEAHENMIRRSGFQYVQTFSEIKTENTEQRQTRFSPYDSLKNGLDFKKEKTIEGYPPPWRFLTRAVRGRSKRK